MLYLYNTQCTKEQALRVFYDRLLTHTLPPYPVAIVSGLCPEATEALATVSKHYCLPVVSDWLLVIHISLIQWTVGSRYHTPHLWNFQISKICFPISSVLYPLTATLLWLLFTSLTTTNGGELS